LARGGDRRLGGRFVGDVGHNPMGVAQLLGRLFEALLRTPADGDGGAVGDETASGTETDATAATGDERRVSVERAHDYEDRAPTGAVGVNCTGIDSSPLMKFAGRRGSGSSVASF